MRAAIDLATLAMLISATAALACAALALLRVARFI